jgi:hypothetical protein
MPTLQFELLKAILEHGAASTLGATVDPSKSRALAQAEVGIVTAYIEQLALLGLVRDPKPMFGADGGMWIGYQLTETGRQLAASEPEMRRALAKLIGGPQSEVSEAVEDLRQQCERAQINVMYRDDFLATLREIGVCFDQHCFIATVSLCGKILEICLKETLSRHDIQVDPNATAGALIRTVRERITNEYIDPALPNIFNIVNVSRNTAIHANELIPIPSRDQTVMVIFATRDLVLRKLIR